MKMKRTLLAAMLPALALAAMAQVPRAAQQAQIAREYQIMGGPGIAISGSQTVDGLPAAAQQLLSAQYGDVAVTRCHENFIKRTYDVSLADGTEITFNADGRVTDIKAGANRPLPEGVLRACLPAKTVSHLQQCGAIGQVNAIKDANGNGFGVALLDNVPPQMIFDANGVFIIVDR